MKGVQIVNISKSSINIGPIRIRALQTLDLNKRSILSNDMWKELKRLERDKKLTIRYSDLFDPSPKPIRARRLLT